MRNLLALALLAATTAGCQTVECGDGTFRSGNDCVGFDPNDKTPPITTATPAGGRSREPISDLVTLTTDESARIFYTTDGSDPDPDGVGETSPVAVVGVVQGTTLKYLAIDRSGNREELHTTTFDSDLTPPAPVANLTLMMTGTTASLTWTNPTDADYAGTVLARVTDLVDMNPMPGMTYSAPTTLSASLQIVAAGKVTTYDDPGRPAGPVRYVAWTYDDLGNYSAPVSVQDETPLGSLTAQFTYDTVNDTLTATTVPDNLDLANTTAALNMSTVTLSLSVKNTSARYFQNMKAEVTSVIGGSFTGSDGTADGFAFRSLGPELVAPGATVVRDLSFTGATGTVTINLTFAHHPSMLATSSQNQKQGIVDLGSGSSQPFLTIASRGPNDRPNGKIRPSQFVGSRYLDIPTTHATIERWDLVTRTRVSELRFSDVERVNIQGLTASGLDTYAVVKYAGGRRTGAAELIRIDEALQITGRLELPRLDDRGFSRPAVSADGSTLAVPLIGSVALVDTKTMKLIDAVPNTPFDDVIEPGFTERIRSVEFFNGTDGLLVLARNSGRVAIVRRTANDYSVTPFQDTTTTARGWSLATAADGKIWIALESGIRVFDPATGNISNITYGQVPQGLAFVDGAMWIIRSTRTTIDRVSNTGAIQRTITLPAAQGAFGHWLVTAP